MVNPTGIYITKGLLTILSDLLDITNVTVLDSSGTIWITADGATYDVLDEAGESTGIKGEFIYDSDSQTWQALDIDPTSLASGNYRIKYQFFNSTSSGITYSDFFDPHPTSETSTSTTNTLLPIPGFLIVLTIIALGVFTKSKKHE